MLAAGVLYEDLVPGYVHAVNERQSCWVASLHHDLCGQALALTADVLRYGLRVASGEPQRPDGPQAGEPLDRLILQVNNFLGYSLRCRSNEFTAALLRQAERMGMPAILIDIKDGLFSIGACRGSRLICSSSNDGDSYFGAVICNQKQKTNLLLRRLGLPAPRQCLATSENHLSAAIREVGYPCVVKPASAERGEGVTVGIQGEEELKAAFTKAKQVRSEVLVEQQVSGLLIR
jgi:cyanophycin synthetase